LNENKYQLLLNILYGHGYYYATAYSTGIPVTRSILEQVFRSQKRALTDIQWTSRETRKFNDNRDKRKEKVTSMKATPWIPSQNYFLTSQASLICQEIVIDKVFTYSFHHWNCLTIDENISAICILNFHFSDKNKL